VPSSRSITFKEFNAALGELCLAPDEASFLFQFWDTMAGQQEAQGAVDIQLVVTDLIGSVPTYSTGFNSGPEGFKSNGNKSNRSSVQGGIFGGGSYAADAVGEAPQLSNRASYAPSAPAMAPPTNKPRGNQSSIEGGIFGGMDGSAPLAPQPSNRANRSNQSSVDGGIFSAAGPNCAPATNRSNRSNQSSIPGGIFG